MENEFSCILIEDEALGIEMLQDYISRRSDLSLVGTATQRSEIQSLLRICSPTIIFLDLVIPYGDKNDFNYSKFPKSSIFVIISATPLSHYNGEIPFGKIHELLKPISYENFNKCIDKILRNIKVTNV
jgi:response regulator of citrate/malate metabolism